jgi:hypothetical protein
MAGGVFSLAKLFGMTIRESATDGSDFTNPDADYRRLFLGEDGQLHVKDSAGTVTDIGGSTQYYTRLAEQIAAGGSTANFDFTSISGSYRSLEIHVVLRSQVAAVEVAMACRFNNDSGANYNTTRMFATNTNPTGDSFDAQTSMANLFVTTGSTATANVATSHKLFIPRYADTVFQKQIIVNSVAWSSSSSTTFNRSVQNVGKWASTAAVTRITLFPSSGNLVDGSVATLYGIN